LFKLYVAIIVPIVLVVLAVGAYAGTEPAGAAMASETADVKAATAAAVQAVADSHRIARAKCGHLVGVERGNCRTEARAEAKRALRIAKATAVPA
jgi:hypothetical protein